MQLPDINLESITDPAARQLIGQLLNVIEALHTDLLSLHTENQQLRDELARLKGGSGKPDVKPNTATPATDHSSEAERHTPTPRGKPQKNASLTVTREQPCVVDPATLPLDAVRHGTTTVIVQDLRLQAEVIRFVREVWYVPSTKQTITAPLPDGYHGAFGPHIQALALSLAYDAQVTQPALVRFFQDAAIQIGAGTLARWLADDQTRWQAEAEAIHQAGVASGPWQATDQTSTRVDGRNESCHVLGNCLFTLYQTRPGGARQDVLAVLWGREPLFRLNDDALEWLRATALNPHLLARIQAALPWNQEVSAAELNTQLAVAGISLGVSTHLDPRKCVRWCNRLVDGQCAIHAHASAGDWLPSSYSHAGSGHGRLPDCDLGGWQYRWLSGRSSGRERSMAGPPVFESVYAWVDHCRGHRVEYHVGCRNRHTNTYCIQSPIIVN